jgi:hypothetical protein
MYFDRRKRRSSIRRVAVKQLVLTAADGHRDKSLNDSNNFCGRGRLFSNCYCCCCIFGLIDNVVVDDAEDAARAVAAATQFRKVFDEFRRTLLLL